MASEQQIKRRSRLLTVKIVKINRLAHQSTTPTNKRRQWQGGAEHTGLMSGPPLMSVLGVHKNIPLSDTNLTLGLRVGFISSHLASDKLFPVNPRSITSHRRWASYLRLKYACINHQTKAFPCYAFEHFTYKGYINQLLEREKMVDYVETERLKHLLNNGFKLLFIRYY